MTSRFIAGLIRSLESPEVDNGNGDIAAFRKAARISGEQSTAIKQLRGSWPKYARSVVKLSDRRN